MRQVQFDQEPGCKAGCRRLLSGAGDFLALVALIWLVCAICLGSWVWLLLALGLSLGAVGLKFCGKEGW